MIQKEVFSFPSLNNFFYVFLIKLISREKEERNKTDEFKRSFSSRDIIVALKRNKVQAKIDFMLWLLEDETFEIQTY